MQVMKAQKTCMIEGRHWQLENQVKDKFDIAPELSSVNIMRSTVEGKAGKPLTGCFPSGSSGLNSGALNMACPSGARICATQAMAINRAHKY